MNKNVILFILLFTFSSFLQEKQTFDVNQQLIDEKIVFVFAGDIMGHSPQFKAAYDPVKNQFDYNPCFQFVKPYIQNADYAFANLEVPLAGQPYSGYPNFSSPDALLDATKNAGFDVILTANNHVADRGKKGLERTIRTIQKSNLLFAGSYTTKLQRDTLYPIILNCKGVKIAVLNCTYGTNMNPVYKPNIVNNLDSTELMNDINKAKQLYADIIIAVVHWGTEYELVSNQVQQNMAKFLVDQGVNAIIGSHPHVVQNAEYLNNISPVVYSLGNFISNQRTINTNGGIMIKLEISKISKSITSLSYLPIYVHRGHISGKYQYYLIPTTDYIKAPEKFKIPTFDSIALNLFDTNTRIKLNNIPVWEKFN